jgi:hypothetical protein
MFILKPEQKKLAHIKIIIFFKMQKTRKESKKLKKHEEACAR